MKNKILEELRNKKILILGLGLEGISTYKFLNNLSSSLNIFLADKNIDSIVTKHNIQLSSDNLISNMDIENLLKEYDVIFKTPGITFLNINYKPYIHKITSQVDMFLKYSNNKTIGITGTKGKSTTTSLLYNVIKNEYSNTVIAGNIGIPIFDEIDNINEDTIIVFELSSHQLQFLRHSPKIAVILNFYEEHLDFYESYQDYKNSKLNIVGDNTNVFIYDKSIENECFNIECLKHIVVDFNNKENILSYDFSNKTKLLGEHNQKNIYFVLRILEELNINLNNITKSITEFNPLKHRLENVGEYRDITFYNDSISTIPETTISCIKSIPNLTTLIIGGMDRGVNYDSLIKYINESNLSYIICLPDTGHKISKDITKQKFIVSDLNEAINIVFSINEKQICALSPGASSYHVYKNFEQRGEHFKTLILENSSK